MKIFKFLIFGFCLIAALILFLTIIFPKQNVNELQKSYNEIYELRPNIHKRFLTVDDNGNIHLITIIPKSDVIVFYNHEIENNIKRDFNKNDITQ